MIPLSRKQDPESEWKHGTDYTYRYRGCRCITCTHHNAAKSWSKRHKRPMEEYPGPISRNYAHGSIQRYNTGCNCNMCTVTGKEKRLEKERIQRFRETLRD